jgi:hypothetical protein
MPRKSLVLAILTLVSMLAPASAQVRQYTPPGGIADLTEGRKEGLERAAEDARWSLGRLRVDPALWISDIALVDSSDDDVGTDLTGRIGAGLRTYLPVGGKTTLAAYALPEYVWWREREDERRLNQRFGVGAFTYFNRLTIELTGERREDFEFVTSEFFQRVSGRSDEFEVLLEFPLFKRLSFFASGRDTSFESLAEDQALDDRISDLNRTDRTYRGGVRYRPTETLYFGAGVGRAESDFDEEALDRSNAGDLWYVELRYDRPKLSIAAQIEESELEGEPGSTFGRFEGETGSVAIGWNPRERFGARAYASRAVAYSLLLASDSGYLDERYGAGLSVGLGHRFTFDLFAETGTLDYLLELGSSGRRDDLESYGASVSVELGRKLLLKVGYRYSMISSAGLPDREIDEILGSLELGIGGGSGTWF